MNIKQEVIQMAQAHARIEAKFYQQRGSHESQGILNGNMTMILDLVFEGMPENPPELYELYINTFWKAYGDEVGRQGKL